jgi:hypothetical protein
VGRGPGSLEGVVSTVGDDNVFWQGKRVLVTGHSGSRVPGCASC